MVHGWPYERFQKIPYTSFDYSSLNFLVKMLIIKYSQITIQSLHLEWFEDILNYVGKELST